MNKKKMMGPAIAMLMLALISFSCSNQYEPQDYSMDTIDEAVCSQFTDTLFVRVQSVNPTAYNASWFTADSIINEAGAVIDSLTDNGKTFVTDPDTIYRLSMEAGSDTTYLHLMSMVGNSSKEFVFYFTDYIKLNLYKPNGAEVVPTDLTYPIVTFMGCLNDTLNPVEPIIKTRKMYMIDSPDLLMQLISTDQTASRAMKAIAITYSNNN